MLKPKISFECLLLLLWVYQTFWGAWNPPNLLTIIENIKNFCVHDASKITIN